MKKYWRISFMVFIFMEIFSCNRKSTPSKPENISSHKAEVSTSKKAEAVKPKAPIKTPTPKIITVNDKAATKSVEGRYYYDLEGKRYWRNKRDGKYYLYYKGMFDKPDFQ